jgi:hypothetical protein
MMISKALELSKGNQQRLATLLELQEKIRLAEEEDLRKRRCYIDFLPTETLHDIFLYVSQEDEFAFHHLILAGVCRHWRSIITSDQRFWRHFVLPKRHVREISELWNLCSKEQIEHLLLPVKLDRNKLNAGLQLLANNRRPLRTLILHESSAPALLETSPRLFQPDHIQQLIIDNNDDHIGEPFVRFFPNVALPSLDRFYWSGTGEGASKYMEVPMPKLKFCTLNVSTPYSQPLLLLQAMVKQDCNGLESFSLSIPLFLGSRWDGYEIPALVLPKLRELTLEIGLSRWGQQFLSQMALPSLTSLTLVRFNSPMDQVIDGLSPPEVLPKLKRLTLRRCHFTEQKLQAQISQMLSLQHLEISHTGSPTNRIIDAIAESGSSQHEILCPALTSLNLARSSTAAEPCIRLVRARNPAVDTAEGEVGVSRLQYLNMDYCQDLDPKLLRYLEAKVPFFSAKPPEVVRRR